jgi:TfuA protein
VKPVIFLGPSLERETAETVLDAIFQHPISRGDLSRVVDDGASTVGIIDGVFDQSLAVSIFEIRSALKRGVNIWGAASMGALRAVECRSLGMKGVGWIYEQFDLGRLTADDEVALLFEPLTGRPISIPLVNLRWAVTVCIERRLLTPTEVYQLIALAEEVPFRFRTEQELSRAADCGACGESMRKLLRFIRENREISDRKRMDALLLLQQLAKEVSID